MLESGHLMVSRTSLIVPWRGAIRWLGVVNPKAGRFKAERVAREVYSKIGDSMILYHTSPDDGIRQKDLRSLLKKINPSRTHPLGIIAFGGDRTLNDSLVAALHHVFPVAADLFRGDPDSVTERMMESGLYLGSIPLGGANDVAEVHGAPKKNIENIVDYITRSEAHPLNLGMAVLDDDEENPVHFCHSLSGGTAIAPVYEATVGERGIWAKRHREWLGFWNVVRQKPVLIQWENKEQRGLEVIAHAVVRANGKNGFPGTPQPGGLGIKVFPQEGFWKSLKTFFEIQKRGWASSLKNNPSRLMPEERLKSLPPELQLHLEVGEEKEFYFLDPKGGKTTVAIQANGDHVKRAHKIRVRALPSFWGFLTRAGSLMDNLRALDIENNLHQLP